ncbi:MAG TPA: CBS domain-containing protein [Rhizomicrobium sp.]|jgi:CBS domain-containing protein|nr:CBS domain-containing protein [Rhizomicrobium sp.]
MSSAAVMSKSPITVREQESVSDAVLKLVSNHFTNLPVLDSQERYIGTFGIYDLLSLLVPRVALAGDLMSNLRFIADDPEELRRKYQDVRNRPVSEFVNRNAPTLDPDSPQVEAIRLFCRNHISLPVVDRKSGRLLGIVSCWDAVRSIVSAG